MKFQINVIFCFKLPIKHERVATNGTNRLFECSVVVTSPSLKPTPARRAARHTHKKESNTI